MQDATSHAATAPPSGPEATLTESARAAAADLTHLAARMPGGIPGARIADRLSEELAEIGQMLRALPHRPAMTSGHDHQLLTALRTAHTAGEDVAETIARALARLAYELGGSPQVIAARPGSWEAAVIEQLLSGTVGPADENLGAYRTTS
jgi:hypothetical protein